LKSLNKIHESIWLSGNLIGYSLDLQKTKKLLSSALENGINKIDTSSSYCGGASEKILGCLLKKQREKWIISTKLGIKPFETYNKLATKNNINLMIDNSLKNLKTDYLDYYLLHHFDKETSLFETISTLNSNVIKGKIKNFGFCNLNKTEIKKILKVCIKINSFPKILQIECNICNPYNYYNVKTTELNNNIAPMFYGVFGRGNFVKNKIPIFKKNKKDRLILNQNILEEYEKPALVKLRLLLNQEAERRKIPVSLLLIYYCKYLCDSAQIVLGLRTASQINNIFANKAKTKNKNFKKFEKTISKIPSIKYYKKI